MLGLTRLVRKAQRETPDRVAVICGDRRATCAEFAGRVARLAGALRGLGLPPDEPVAMLALNSDRTIEAFMASMWAGGAFCPQNTRWSVPELAYALGDSGARILIVDEVHAPAAAALRAECPSVETVVTIGCDGTPDAHDYEALIARSAPVEDAGRAGADLAAVLYTGGTTGFSKGVELSHDALVSNAVGLNAAVPHAGDAPGLHAAPMFHVAGIAGVIQFFMRRAPQVVMPAFEPAAALELIERERIGDAFLVPAMLRFMVDHPDMARRDVSSIRQLRYGAAPIDLALLRRAMAAFPGSGFTQVYGQTEAGPCVTALGHEEHLAAAAPGGDEGILRSAGRPIPVAEVKICDEEGRELPSGEVGEILVRGPGLMTRYRNKPEQTAEALRDGWLRSGDAGRMDSNGYLFIEDRVKDMIVSGGENVYSAEVENALATLDGVAACAVIGVPSERWGEQVHAIIVPRDGAALTEAQVQAHCEGLIAGYKRPRSVSFVKELPLSPAGKVLKHVLREPWWEGRDRKVG